MIAVILALTLVIVGAIAADYLTPLVSEWLHRRDVVRHHAEQQQMQAMRAARELSLMAWRARHEMYDIASQNRAPRSGHPAKHN